MKIKMGWVIVIIGLIIIVGLFFVFNKDITKQIQECADETSGLELGQAKMICKEQVCNGLSLAKRNDCYGKVESIVK